MSTPHNFGAPAPILRVASVSASFAYYMEALGFHHNWGESGLASVSRDRCTLFLCEWDQGQPGTWVWIGVDDADAVHEELVARGARIRFPPTSYDWAYEMQVMDLDGNVLRLCSAVRPDVRPGPFLDGKGVLWHPPADGCSEWTADSGSAGGSTSRHGSD